ncbi:MAG TPA: hypothetical protein VLM40_02795, partial [Gemmata sp.]|nr:hypothetical protein [Gemmata sp.]
ITLYNNISTSITELRSELNRERDTRTDFVKKDEFNSRTSNQYERMRSFESLKADFEGMKERVNGTSAGIESVRKDLGAISDAAKKDVAALEVLKERVGAIEGLKKDIASIEGMKDKLATALTDLKSLREDVAKVHKEQDRNQASDLERKISRDTQFKQIEETMKELQKGLQDCREKLARLEGAQPKPKSGGKPASGDEN